jgi:predicted DNA-binding transcriptional regulator AlpA
MTRQTEQLLDTKALAGALQKSPRYIYAMLAKGFQMPGRVATVSEARKWLARNPAPCSRPKSRK